MSDIVERLRAQSKFAAPTAHEAADEIERLQQLCDARQDHLDEGGKIIDGLRERIENDGKLIEGIRAATIEECAKAAEECYDKGGDDMGFTVPAAIRARKGINCATCGGLCRFIDNNRGSGWYCKACDAFTETDVEVEE